MQLIDSDIEDVDRSYHVSVPRSSTFFANKNTVNMSRAVNRLDLFTFSQSFVLVRLSFVCLVVLAIALVLVVCPVAAHTGQGRHAFRDLKC